MNIHDNLFLLSKRLSDVMDTDIIITWNDEVDKPEYSSYRKYIFFIENRPCYIFTERNVVLGEREQALIKYLLNKEISSINNSKFNEQNLIKVITEALKKDEKEEIIKDLNINTKEQISVILIKPFKKDFYEDIVCLISNINREDIQTIRLNDNFICVLFRNSNFCTIRSMCEAMMFTMESELLGQAKIGVGNPKIPYELNESYEEAIKALDIGSKYQLPTNVYYYEDLTIYNLIFSLEKDKIKYFYKKAIRMNFRELSEEELKTANTFIENNLNLSKTAKILYIHRNTLTYRLDKINEITKLNIRTFNDAVEFKILFIIYKAHEYME